VSQQTTNRSFDDLARALAEGSISRRRALKLFAGTAIAALIPSRALAKQQKVTICHKPGTPDEETKEVSQSAVDAHLRHGDQLGPCEMCLPNCASCSSGSECCSGFCTIGQCVAEGPTGTSCSETSDCSCWPLADNSRACVDASDPGPPPIQGSCDQCPPPGFPEHTLCSALVGVETHLCLRPCPDA
jgi:hypothetical protein